jgi:enamine deaminase RidA (YjgF/YER057c/UK114 family)
MTHYIKVASLFPPPDYAHAAIVEGDRLVFTAGAVPLDAAGELVGPGDFIAQTKQVLVTWMLLSALRAAISSTLSTLRFMWSRPTGNTCPMCGR